MKFRPSPAILEAFNHLKAIELLELPYGVLLDLTRWKPFTAWPKSLILQRVQVSETLQSLPLAGSVLEHLSIDFEDRPGRHQILPARARDSWNVLYALRSLEVLGYAMPFRSFLGHSQNHALNLDVLIISRCDALGHVDSAHLGDNLTTLILSETSDVCGVSRLLSSLSSIQNLALHFNGPGRGIESFIDLSQSIFRQRELRSLFIDFFHGACPGFLFSDMLIYLPKLKKLAVRLDCFAEWPEPQVRV